MNFKDMLGKYRKGTASEEEKRIIEEELEKQELISEYLSESYDIGFEKSSLYESDDNETVSVKRSVNKKLRKVILLSVSIVFLILLTIKYIISPIVSNFYYNPSQKTVGKYQNDLFFDLRVFTELNLPGYATTTVSSEGLGFGEYSIYFARVNLFNRESKDVNVKIKRNLRIGSFQDFFAKDNFGFWDITQPDSNMQEFNNIWNERYTNNLKALNPVSYVSCNIVFKEDISIKEFDRLKNKYGEKINFKWVGVRTQGKDKPANYLSGFNPNFNDLAVTGDSADKEKYPYLQLVDYMGDKEAMKKFNGSFEDAYSKHFISMLKYMNDRKKAVLALDNNSSKVEYYNNALNYVKNNGINIYGVLIYAEAKDLLELLNNEEVKSLEINGVLPSKYIN